MELNSDQNECQELGSAGAAVTADTAAADCSSAAPSYGIETFKSVATGNVCPLTGATLPCPVWVCWLIAAAVILAAAGCCVLLFRRKKQKTESGKKGGRKNTVAADPVEIYVGNLSYDMKDPQLRKEFERYGIVKSARVITERVSHKSKGFGFVQMPYRKEAMCAIQALNNREIMGRKLRVNEARSNSKFKPDNH